MWLRRRRVEKKRRAKKKGIFLAKVYNPQGYYIWVGGYLTNVGRYDLEIAQARDIVRKTGWNCFIQTRNYLPLWIWILISALRGCSLGRNIHINGCLTAMMWCRGHKRREEIRGQRKRKLELKSLVWGRGGKILFFYFFFLKETKKRARSLKNQSQQETKRNKP